MPHNPPDVMVWQTPLTTISASARYANEAEVSISVLLETILESRRLQITGVRERIPVLLRADVYNSVHCATSCAGGACRFRIKSAALWA